jgi:integrase
MFREELRNPKLCFEGFELYTLRHTYLTRWAPHRAPWTLAYLAGHRGMNITSATFTQEQTIRAAMDRAQVANGGHTSGHSEQKADLERASALTPTI